LARQRENDAAVFLSRLQSGARRCLRHLKPGPLSPQINSRRGFQNVRDICAADAGSDLQKIKLVVGFALDEFSMSSASLKSHRFYQTPIDFQELPLISRAVGDRLRDVGAATMGHLHRWAPVLVYSGEDDAAVIHQRVNVKD